MLLIKRGRLDLLFWVIDDFIVGITVIITDGLGTSSSFILMILWSYVAIWSNCRHSILDVETGMLELLGQISQVGCFTINVVHWRQAAILKVQVICMTWTLLRYHSVVTLIWPSQPVRLKNPADAKGVRLLSLSICLSVISKELALPQFHGVILSSLQGFIDLLKQYTSAYLSLKLRITILRWTNGMHLTALGIIHDYISRIRIFDWGPSRWYFLFLLKHLRLLLGWILWRLRLSLVWCIYLVCILVIYLESGHIVCLLTHPWPGIVNLKFLRIFWHVHLGYPISGLMILLLRLR